MNAVDSTSGFFDDRQPPQMFVASVDSVQADGSLNLVYRGAVIDGVNASQDCDAQAGDAVIVATIAKDMFVMCRAGGQRPEPFPDLTPYALKSDIPTVPPRAVVTWSTGAPSGAGWVQAENVYLRKRAGQAPEVHGRLASSQPEPEPDPDPDPPRPSPVTTTPTATGAWRDGKRDHGEPPRQSKYSSSFGPYTGAWFFDNLRGHTSGKSVSTMTITLTRSKTSNGISGGARVRLYLTSASSPKSSPPSRYSSVWSPGTLARGQRKTFTVPAVWAQHLAAGQARGIVCYSSTRSESIVFTESAPIRITFN